MRPAIETIWLLLAAVSVKSSRAQPTDRDVTVYSWPLNSANSQQLAKISYNPVTLTTTINEYSPPGKSQEAEELVRVGLRDGTSDWHGVVTSAESFDGKYQQKLSLHIDEEGEVWHVGISTQLKPVPSKAKGQVQQTSQDIPQIVVEIVMPTPGASPLLNKPVVLNADGKIPQKDQEKTLFQK